MTEKRLSILVRVGAGQRHVQEVIKRCSSPEDLMLAVQALERLRRHRASVLNHEPFNHNTSKAFAQVSSAPRQTLRAARATFEGRSMLMLSVLVLLKCQTRNRTCWVLQRRPIFLLSI